MRYFRHKAFLITLALLDVVNLVFNIVNLHNLITNFLDWKSPSVICFTLYVIRPSLQLLCLIPCELCISGDRNAQDLLDYLAALSFGSFLTLILGLFSTDIYRNFPQCLARRYVLPTLLQLLGTVKMSLNIYINLRIIHDTDPSDLFHRYVSWELGAVIISGLRLVAINYVFYWQRLRIGDEVPEEERRSSLMTPRDVELTSVTS